MAQFLILESTNADGKPTELCINVDQVCRAYTLGAPGTVESVEVQMSDGQKILLQAEAAEAFFALVTHPRNSVEMKPSRST
jgi:hypothetical protein